MASPFRLYGGALRPDAISGLNAQFGGALDALFAAAPPEVQRELGLSSAYRSPEVQRQLWEASDKSGRMVAAPGKSKHNYGLAADLFGFGLKGNRAVSQATKDWVHANAARFGLAFPMDYEPWHIQLADTSTIPEDMVWDDKGMYHAGQQGVTPEQRRAAIASIESAGSGDYSALGPSVSRRSGAGPGPSDRAYGRYQVMGSNIGPWAQQYLQMTGVTPDQYLKDPQLQDKLFDAVYGDYVKKYGERGAASMWFTGRPDEPNVSDVNNKLTGKSYADRYMAALGTGSTLGQAAATGAGKGAAGAATPYTALPTTADDKKPKTWGDTLSAGLGGIGDAYAGGGGEGFSQAPPRGVVPVQQPAPQAATPMINPTQADDVRRQMLAQLMAKYWIA